MARQTTTFEWVFPPRDEQTPAYRWLYGALRSAILEGRLRPGARLPGTRDLAQQYGLSRGTIVAAFEQLSSEGYVEGSVGSGTYVSTVLPDDLLRAPRQRPGSTTSTRPRRSLSTYARRLNLSAPLMDLRPPRAFRTDLPAVELFPIDLWTQIAARRLRRLTSSELLGADPLGYQPLRVAIADYLVASRGVKCDADQIAIVSGVQDALDIVARLVLEPGDRVCMEDPGYQGATAIFESVGAQVDPVPLDEQGLQVPRTRSRKTRLVYVTPGHQFPLGMTMTLARRLELLEWARTRGALIFEDDYDSEYRYSGRPIPALQGLDAHAQVLFFGTFSKVLFPSLRVAYLVVPHDLVPHVQAAIAGTRRHAPVPDQAVLCDFITGGDFARHLRRMRQIYAERLGVLMDAARAWCRCDAAQPLRAQASRAQRPPPRLRRDRRKGDPPRRARAGDRAGIVEVGKIAGRVPPKIGSTRRTLMDVDRDHVVHLVNGRLSKTSRADLARMIKAALAPDKPELVLHFHGGLVKESSGREIAKRLAPRYAAPSRYPLFFVWESGFLEAIANNLGDVKDDPLFRELVKKATRWVLEQLPGVAGLKGAGGQVNPDKLDAEYEAYFNGVRNDPPTALQPKPGADVQLRSASMPDDENELELKIRQELENDDTFKARMLEVHESIDADKVGNESGTVSPVTKVSPQQVGDLFDVKKETKGIFTIAKASLFIAKVVIAVVRRFRSGRAHGVYTTIVEEILANAYIDKVGGIIWGQMKKDTVDAFGNSPDAGGEALLAEIAKQQKETGKKFARVVLIGHSTGAIYICNLVDRAATVLPDAKFDVIFLAPAVTHERFAQTIGKHAARINKFRQFAMRDAVECNDVLVPILYPRSLLYFVSGLVEFAENKRAADTPIVGMERYRLDAETFGAQKFPHIDAVEKFFGGHDRGLVWSLTEAGAANGSISSSKKHGDFDNEETTIASVVHVLNSGF